LRVIWITGRRERVAHWPQIWALSWENMANNHPR
jgi:hypothetical protein